MTEPNHNQHDEGLTRRQVLHGALAGGAVLSASGLWPRAARARPSRRRRRAVAHRRSARSSLAARCGSGRPAAAPRTRSMPTSPRSIRTSCVSGTCTSRSPCARRTSARSRCWSPSRSRPSTTRPTRGSSRSARASSSTTARPSARRTSFSRCSGSSIRRTQGRRGVDRLHRHQERQGTRQVDGADPAQVRQLGVPR